VRRRPALQDLSRDHFVALTAVVGVRRVVERDRFAKPEAEAKAVFLHLARLTLPEHLDEEERFLLPLLRAGPAAEEKDRLLEEHARLRGLFAKLAPESPLASFWEAAQLLQQHIRWEEDHLFERLQREASPDTLDRLLADLTARRRVVGLPVGPS